MVYVRVRLRFDSSPLHYAKKCWFVFDADQCSLVKDVAYLIARQFDLNQGIQLYMDDFLIPVNESAQVIRDNDLIRVTAVECKSSNTTVVLSEDKQSPKAKRRKADKGDGQKKQAIAKTKVGAVRTTAPKSAIAASTTNQQIKPLISSTKVGKSSSKSKPLGVKPLKAVTKKSSSGALHITFQSSSSSESTSESESSSSDSSDPDTIVGKNQGSNNALANRTGLRKVTNVTQTLSTSLKSTPPNGNRSSAKGENGQTANAGVSVNRRGGRKRKRVLPTNLTVGGSRDVLTTKSTIYKSPVMNKKTSASNLNHRSRSKESSETDSSSSESSDSVTDKTSTAPTTTNTDGKEAKKPTSQWDVQPAIGPCQPIAANSASVNVPPPVAEQAILQPPRDYSTLPELQGPPRQGDKLAFKILELSSSYTPVVSEYKEATVLNFDPSSKLIQVEYSEETLMKLKCNKDKGKLGKFELEMDEEDKVSEPQILDRCDEITLDSLIEPKLNT